jgi:hypothetical protein
MRKYLFFVLVSFIFIVPSVSFSYNFSDDFNDGNLTGWTPKQGTWTNSGTDIRSDYNYGVIWKDDSFGVYQKIQVDAYFDLEGSDDNQIAHLRLRTNEQPDPWNTGYLAEFYLDYVSIYKPYSGFSTITSYIFGGINLPSPIISTGWYTLTFSVEGKGANTHFEMWINNTQYIDYNYLNLETALDSGYVGLGRLIRYDNAQGYSSNTPVPEPTTMLLLSLGLVGLAGIRRTYK